MDPLGNQPAQPNPQPPVTPAPAPITPTAQPAEPLAPTSESATVNNTSQAPNIDRPVEAWPPAGTPAATEAAKIAAAPTPSPQPPAPASPTPTSEESKVLGTEVSEAAGAIPIVTPPPTPGANQGMDGFVSPAAKEIKESIATNPTPPEAPMSDTQADQLFQEEPATKARNKRQKLKKVLIGAAIAVLVAIVAMGVYVFFFGNKAAQTFKTTSGMDVYKDSFSQIQIALGKQPVDSAGLEAGFNKLKVASENAKALAPIPLGSLNPNYKKAQKFDKSAVAYRAKAQAYQTKYTDYTDYLKALSDAFSMVADLDDLKSTDLTTTTAEKLTTDLNTLLKSCNAASTGLKQATKPSELSKSSQSLQEALVRICTESIDSLEDGPLVLLTGKTGVLNAEDQAKMRLYLDTYGSTSTSIASKTVDPNANIEQLNTYKQVALEDATSLLQEVEDILKS